MPANAFSHKTINMLVALSAMLNCLLLNVESDDRPVSIHYAAFTLITG